MPGIALPDHVERSGRTAGVSVLHTRIHNDAELDEASAELDRLRQAIAERVRGVIAGGGHPNEDGELSALRAEAKSLLTLISNYEVFGPAYDDA